MRVFFLPAAGAWRTCTARLTSGPPAACTAPARPASPFQSASQRCAAPVQDTSKIKTVTQPCEANLVRLAIHGHVSNPFCAFFPWNGAPESSLGDCLGIAAPRRPTPSPQPPRRSHASTTEICPRHPRHPRPHRRL